jgi:uncharacterized protein YdaU (DUF1376 family)
MKFPYFPFYPADWLSGQRARAMSAEERGYYIDILCWMWKDHEACSLPDEPVTICRMLGIRPAKWKQLRSVFIEGSAPVFFEKDGKIFSERLQKEWKKTREKSEKNSQAAKAKAEKFSAKVAENKGTTSADAQRTVCERSANGVQHAGASEVRRQISESDKGFIEPTSLAGSDAGHPSRPVKVPPEKIDFDYHSGRFSGITEEQLSIWNAAAPAVNVLVEINKAAAWAVGNPKNRKSDWKRFLTKWILRAQDSAPRHGGGPSAPGGGLVSRQQVLRDRNAESTRRLLESMGEGGDE